MRTKLKGGLVLLVAVLAVGVAGVSAASAALPEFSGSTGAITGVMGKSKMNALGASWTCEKGINSGEYLNSTTLKNVTLAVQNCNKTPMECYTHAKSEVNVEVALSGLQATLGYLNKATKQVGLKFETAKNKCEDEDFGAQTYVGNLIGTITPVNTKAKSFTVHVAVVGGSQEDPALEGEVSNPFKVTSVARTFPETVEIAEFHFTTEKETEISA